MSILVQVLFALLGTLGVPSVSTFLVDRLIKKEVDQLGPGPVDGAPVGTLERDFQQMLRKYYAHGLTAARINLVTSVSFSVLGGLVLLGGVSLAIWKSETDGELYAAMVASLAGLVMSIAAILFHRRADKSLAHLTEQTRNLRADMAVERDVRQAVAILEKIEVPALKAQLEAALVLKLAQAEIPVLHGINLNGTGSVSAASTMTMPESASVN
ncbi:TRADD-N-associated membrane domain-containing protein [Streptomyces anulatus]|uniref:TRADD-N-associated membrane domain-containing protein n=1 Tax=Streptomyces anulatus TaxID=1892 RepID=UPI00342158C3